MILLVQDCWKAMQQGSKMIKLDASRKGHHKKTFVLDQDMAGIRYEPSKKNSRCKLITSGNLGLQEVFIYRTIYSVSFIINNDKNNIDSGCDQANTKKYS